MPTESSCGSVSIFPATGDCFWSDEADKSDCFWGSETFGSNEEDNEDDWASGADEADEVDVVDFILPANDCSLQSLLALNIAYSLAKSQLLLELNVSSVPPPLIVVTFCITSDNKLRNLL